MRWLVVILLGVGLGVLAAMGSAAALDPTPTLRAVRFVAGLGAVWAGAAVLGGWLLARAPWSVLAGPLVLVAAVSGHYAWASATGDGVTSFGDLSDRTQLVLFAGILMGPLLGLVGGVARTGDMPGTLARMLIPIGLATEVVVRYPLHSVEYTADPIRAWTSTCLLLIGVMGATIAMVRGQASSQ